MISIALVTGGAIITMTDSIGRQPITPQTTPMSSEVAARPIVSAGDALAANSTLLPTNNASSSEEAETVAKFHKEPSSRPTHRMPGPKPGRPSSVKPESIETFGPLGTQICKFAPELVQTFGALADNVLTSPAITERFTVILREQADRPEVSPRPLPGQVSRRRFYEYLVQLDAAMLDGCRNTPIDVTFSRYHTTITSRRP